jgi:hypothetical protein
VEIETFETLDDMDDFHKDRRRDMSPSERLKIFGQLKNVRDASEEPFAETGIPVRFKNDESVVYV